jgi:CRISPR-associated endonuclease Cas1
MLPWSDTLYGVIKNGVLTLSGYSISIREQNGTLVVKDGLKGRTEIERRYARAFCPVSRLLVVRSEGYLTLRAVRLLRDVGATLTVLDYDGSPILMSAPKANVRAKLRRSQALLSLDTPLGASIARSLVRAKVAGQIEVLNHSKDTAAAEAASVFAARIGPDTSCSYLLGIEARVSAIYWQSLAGRTLQFGRRQSVPDHWKLFGARHSTLSDTPRHAVTPGNASLNYLYSVAIGEITIALHALGLDPALGIMHADKDDRMSLAYDLIEPMRPIIDRWLFDWLETMTFSKRDFREDSSGEIRLTHPLNSHLAMTAPLWRRSAEQLAEWFCKQLTDHRPREKASTLPKFTDTRTGAGRPAERWQPGNWLQRPIPRTCKECGKALPGRDRTFCSDTCAHSYHGGPPAHVGLAAIAQARAAGGKRRARHKPKISITSVREWREQPHWSAARDREMRDWFVRELLPRLREDIRPVTICKTLGITKSYSIAIKHGRMVPHPRLYRALAALVNVEYPGL